MGAAVPMGRNNVLIITRAMRSALFALLLCLMALAAGSRAARAAPVQCATRAQVGELLYMAAIDDAVARFLFDLGGPTNGADAGDIENEQRQLLSVAEDMGLVAASAVTRDVAGGSPGHFIWSADDAFGVLTYGSSSGSSAAGTTPCDALLGNATLRRAMLLPTMYQLVVARTMLTGESVCSDINERAQRDPVTGTFRCVCAPTKVCGEHGARHFMLIILSIVLFTAIVLIVVATLLFVSTQALQKLVAQAPPPTPAAAHTQQATAEYFWLAPRPTNCSSEH